MRDERAFDQRHEDGYSTRLVLTLRDRRTLTSLAIEEAVLGLESLQDSAALVRLLAPAVTPVSQTGTGVT